MKISRLYVRILFDNDNTPYEFSRIDNYIIDFLTGKGVDIEDAINCKSYLEICAVDEDYYGDGYIATLFEKEIDI